MKRFLMVIAVSIPWLLAASVGFWFLTIRYPADGVTRFSFPLDGRSLWFSPFTPGERAGSPGKQDDGWIGQRVFGDPVYASSRLPGLYDRVQIALSIRPTPSPSYSPSGRGSGTPQIELGLMRDEASFAFEQHPLWSDALQSGWRRVEQGSRRGYVQEDASDLALLTDDPEKILLWGVTSTPPALQDSPGERKTYDISLRGNHNFYVVPAGGRVEFEFLLQDMNRNREGGKNLITFKFLNGDELLNTDALSASGLADRKPTEPFVYRALFRDLAPGVYKLALVADNDIFIRQIATDARRWVIGPRVYFGDDVGYRDAPSPVSVWTNSRHLTVDTLHKEGLQTVSFGKTKRVLAATHTSYAVDRDKSELAAPVRFEAPLSNVRTAGDGYVSLSREALFLPSPRRLTALSDPKAEGVQAILTDYRQPTDLGDGWWRVETSFDRLPEETLRYVLSVPLLARGAAVDIRRVELVYERRGDPWSWREVLRRELSAVRKRL